MAQDLTPEQKLAQFKADIIKQVDRLRVEQLPESHTPDFNINKALRLYYAAYEFATNCGISEYTKAINDAIMEQVSIHEDEEIGCSFHRPVNDISNNVFDLLMISNYVSKSCGMF